MSLTPIEFLKNLNMTFFQMEKRKFLSLSEVEAFLQEKNHKAFSRYLAFAVTVELSRVRGYGCVSFQDRGSHADMDYQTFLRSTKVLFDFYCNHDLSGEQTFASLKKLGEELEEEMFFATGGVNTQKGLVFLTMLFCYCYQRNLELEQYEREIQILTRDMRDPQGTTGSLMRKKYHITTIVEESKQGFPQIFHHFLPLWKQNFHAEDLTVEIFATTYDTTTIKRSGIWEYFQLKSAKYDEKKSRIQLHETLLHTRSTTGGVADLFSSTILLALIDSEKRQNYSWIKKIIWE